MLEVGKGGIDRAELQAALRDGHLLRSVADGDRESQVAFYRLFREQVASILFRLIGDDERLADFVESVFVLCYQRAGSFKNDTSLAIWLYQVCVDVATDALSSSDKEQRDAPDSWALGENHDQRVARELLGKLPLARRIVFFLNEVEGLPVKDIAYIVRAGSFVVRGRLYVARREFYELAGRVQHT